MIDYQLLTATDKEQINNFINNSVPQIAQRAQTVSETNYIIENLKSYGMLEVTQLFSLTQLLSSVLDKLHKELNSPLHSDGKKELKRQFLEDLQKIETDFIQGTYNLTMLHYLWSQMSQHTKVWAGNNPEHSNINQITTLIIPFMEDKIIEMMNTYHKHLENMNTLSAVKASLDI